MLRPCCTTSRSRSLPTTSTAIVATEYDAFVGRLRDAGLEVEDADELWGERRAFVLTPGGGRLEVMAAPPPPSGD